ncbi:MAG: GNAT family N-acetyltransferase [Bacillota bacterium]
MNNNEIVAAIEALHWDYEKEWIPSYIETLEEVGLRAAKNPRMKNVFSNKVIELSASDSESLRIKWSRVKTFFKDMPFSLWLEESQSSMLSDLLRKDGFEITERYDGLAFELSESDGEISHPENSVLIDVEKEEDIRNLVEVSSNVWDYHEDQFAKLMEQRRNYIASPFRKGGYVLALRNSRPVGYSNYRFSSDDKVMYMNGSGVLSEYRNQGIYTEMVNFRLKHARSKGALLATCQARQGHSSSVLQRIGFNQYAEYDYWVYNR